MTALSLVAATLLVGCLIGAVGIGGVLLTPAVVYIAGFDIHVAMATSVFAFVFTGLAGTVAYARRGSLDWRPGARLAAGAVPGALVGAWMNGLVSSSGLKLVLAGVLIFTGIYAARGQRRNREGRMPADRVLPALGLWVGFGSALTGTGGPLVLIPTLMLMSAPALPTVALSQLAQLPVAALGTLGFVLYGRPDLGLGAGLGLTAAIGVAFGAKLAHSLPTRALSRAASLACVAAGLAIVIELVV